MFAAAIPSRIRSRDMFKVSWAKRARTVRTTATKTILFILLSGQGGKHCTLPRWELIELPIGPVRTTVQLGNTIHYPKMDKMTNPVARRLKTLDGFTTANLTRRGCWRP